MNSQIIEIDELENDIFTTVKRVCRSHPKGGAVFLNSWPMVTYSFTPYCTILVGSLYTRGFITFKTLYEGPEGPEHYPRFECRMTQKAYDFVKAMEEAESA